MILCQEGFHPGTKITNGLAGSIIDGVIVSPRYHGVGSLQEYLAGFRELVDDAYLLVDPEFHLGLVPGDKVGKLAEYAHYHDDLNWSSFTSGRIRSYVEETLSFQDALPVSRIVSPATAIRSLEDWQSSACMNLYDESINAVGQPRARESLLLTLIVGDELLNSKQAVDELLNVLTIMECRGFYVTIDRQNAGDTIWCGPGQDAALATLLYLIHVLALNQFEVVCGYTDFPGILMLGAGAAGVASGWYKKQRLFDSARFSPSPPGGRQPKDYYASAPLMNWIPLSPDLDILERSGVLRAVLSGAPTDEVLRDARRAERWTLEVSVHAFWHVVRGADTDMRTMDSQGRAAYVADRLAQAEGVWQAVLSGTRGGPAVSINDANIRCWQDAFADYRERVST